MSYYDNPYSDDAYERYMHTGELAEYFESYSEEEVVEEVVEEEVETETESEGLTEEQLQQIMKELEELEQQNAVLNNF